MSDPGKTKQLPKRALVHSVRAPLASIRYPLEKQTSPNGVTIRHQLITLDSAQFSGEGILLSRFNDVSPDVQPIADFGVRPSHRSVRFALAIL